MSDEPILLTRRYLLVATAVCLLVGVVTIGTLVAAMFDPPPWNRVKLGLNAWACFYVGYLHWRLYRVTPPRDPA